MFFKDAGAALQQQQQQHVLLCAVCTLTYINTYTTLPFVLLLPQRTNVYCHCCSSYNTERGKASYFRAWLQGCR